MLKFILLLFFAPFLLWAEPSMYANNSDFYENGKTLIKQNKKEIERLKQKLQIQEQRLEGLSSVVEGLVASLSVSSEKSEINSPEIKIKEKTSAEKYKDGVRNFSKQRYSKAKKNFTATDEKGYKPAASNYYLGEIAYYTKQDEDAIFHFKKSAGLNDKAGYIDILLLHTAISLERRDEKVQAKAFYQNIIENYQGKKSASIAKEKLKKL